MPAPPVIGAARLDSVWATSFGLPVVPEVSRIQSVCRRTARSLAPGAIVAVHATRVATPGAATAGAAPSNTWASAAAVAAT